MQHLAPIVLFIYNRPEHTRRTLQYLRNNALSEESRLFIFSDAAKTAQDEEKVEDTRAVARLASGFKSVKIILRERHTGLAQSVIEGVTQIVNEYGKVIVFEDDLLASPCTLRYFNEALDKYSKEEKVMQIAAYNFPIYPKYDLPETFFLRSTNSWGWATWKRAWECLNTDIDSLYHTFDKEAIYRFTMDNTMNYWKQFMDFKQGRNDSWAIRWHASVFLHDGLVLYPKHSLIENIGHDGSGVHSIIEDSYNVRMSDKTITYFPDELTENQGALLATKDFFKHRKGSWLKRGRKFLNNQWHKWKNR